MSQRFTGPELVSAVSKGDLQERVSVSLDGMAKAAEEKSDAILFAVGTACHLWTEVPETMIESAEYLRTVPCRDHEHPVVRLILKNPPAENKEATVFASLMRAAGTGAEAEGLETLVRELSGPTGFRVSDRICDALKRCCAQGKQWCCDRVPRY